VKEIGWVGLGIALAACLLVLSVVFGRSMRAAKGPRERLRDDREQLEWLRREAQLKSPDTDESGRPSVIDLRATEATPGGDQEVGPASRPDPPAPRDGEGPG